MATYKVVDTDRLESGLAAVADSIRKAAGTSVALTFPDGMAAAIPYESYTVVPALGTDAIEIPVEEDTTAVFLYMEHATKGLYGNTTYSQYWTKNTQTALFLAWYTEYAMFGYGAFSVAAADNKLLLPPNAAFPYVAGVAYRVIKVRGTLT